MKLSRSLNVNSSAYYLHRKQKLFLTGRVIFRKQFFLIKFLFFKKDTKLQLLKLLDKNILTLSIYFFNIQDTRRENNSVDCKLCPLIPEYNDIVSTG